MVAFVQMLLHYLLLDLLVVLIMTLDVVLMRMSELSYVGDETGLRAVENGLLVEMLLGSLLLLLLSCNLIEIRCGSRSILVSNRSFII